MVPRSKSIHLGFAVGTGEPVEIPLRHLAVTGQTQESGKTTTLEALVSRAGVPALAFVTKRGEGSFTGGRRLQPYFRDRADWQFVSSILDATLQEKNKFLRPWIMKICRDTQTLADVHRAVKKALLTARGIHEGVYTQLDAYLQLIVPEIARADLARSMSLEPGLNVMDVSGHSTPMQMLFIQSAIDWVNEHAHNVVTIVPEAWEFIPEGKSSPVKASAVALVRKGAGIGNYIWVDSQDMAGVDKTILRGCPVWLIGVQREANEIKRNLANIPAGIQRPNAGEIARLDRGQFYACFKDRTVKVYVQPSWMCNETAQAVAFGRLALESTAPPVVASTGLTPTNLIIERPASRQEDEVNAAEAQALRDENEQLRADVDRLTDALKRQQIITPPARQVPPPIPPADTDPAGSISRRGAKSLDGDDPVEMAYQRIKARLLEDADLVAAVLKISTQRPELVVQVERKEIVADGTTAVGRVAQLIAEGFFDSTTAGNAAYADVKRKGFAGAAARIYEACDKLTAMGFLTKESDGYRAVSGMKVRIVER